MFDDLMSVNAMLIVLIFAFASVITMNIVMLLARLGLDVYIWLKKL